ncbi:SCO2400 family protein [Streptomyces iakyrus]|uniref:SCO2400 family protein n=1 Tax=Streptomyces iakyrus TaxID=68219 RepID=UPI003F4B5BAA
MDYCDPCRRHLNGALACPGCGTSAETLRGAREPEYGAGPAGPGPDGPDASVDGYGDVYDDDPYDDDPYDGTRGGDDGDVGEEDAGEGDGEHLGRAARRRGRGRGPVAEGPGGGCRPAAAGGPALAGRARAAGVTRVRRAWRSA